MSLPTVKVFKQEGAGMWALCDVPMTRSWRVRVNGYRVNVYSAKTDRFLKTNGQIGRRLIDAVLATNPEEKFRAALERAKKENLGGRVG